MVASARAPTSATNVHRRKRKLDLMDEKRDGNILSGLAKGCKGRSLTEVALTVFLCEPLCPLWFMPLFLFLTSSWDLRYGPGRQGPNHLSASATFPSAINCAVRATSSYITRSL